MLLYNINLSIIQKRKEEQNFRDHLIFTNERVEEQNFHDRLIFTNAFVYNSGNSISYFDSKGNIRLNNITDLKIIPVTSFAKDKSGSLNSRANYYRKHLRQIHDIIHNLTDNDRSIGNKQNRLLDWAAGLSQ